MGGIAWDKIIGAAAQSTLGILSLGIILVGVLAYPFFGKSDDRVKLWVFGGILLAVIGLGISILRESQIAGGHPSTDPSPTTGPSEAAADATASPIVAASSAPEQAATAPDVSGIWKDNDGFTYKFSVSGEHVSYVQSKTADAAASPVGSGAGTISGRTLQYGYVDNSTGDRGQCSGQVAPDGYAIEGRCTSGGSSWSFRIDRAT
jgi:hypothetical protein